MYEKILFTVIAFMLTGIVWLGVFAAAQHPAEVAAIPETAVEVLGNALGINVSDEPAQVQTQVENQGTPRIVDEDDDPSDDDDRVSIPTQTGGTANAGTATGSTDTQAQGYTMAQVQAHNTASSCYTAISGSVYDLTSFISQHPGGPVITTLCGTDGTAAFMAQHGGQGRPERELASLKIGTLIQ